jgi:phytoene synthase
MIARAATRLDEQPAAGGTLAIARAPVATLMGVDAAYRVCRRIATAHYENFSVGSWLLPRRLRRPIAAIYAFARTADDFADEGEWPAAERLTHLAAWEQQLDACFAGRAVDPLFVALADTVKRFALPIDPFRRLLEAFRRDVHFQAFARFADLLDYCRCSADPVGHLILGLFGYRDAERRELADKICTGLQLANFWQDVAVDAAKDRIYIPLEDLQRFGCTEDDVRRGTPTGPLRELLRFEVERARGLLTAGAALVDRVEPRLAREVRLFAAGGLAILDAIEAQGFDVFTARPTLPSRVKRRLVLDALLPRAARWFSAPRGTALRTELQSEARSARRAGETPASTLNVSGLREAYAHCREITQRSSSNFYYAFRLLPLERRESLCAVYAFCRFVDDIADEAGRRDPRGLLDRWRTELARAYDGTPTHPIGLALADTVRRFPIASQHFLDLIRGVELDLERRRYATFDELHEYCYLVASTVGLICIEIFGHRHESAREYAVDLGVAFQLTNILRDVMEDAERGRIYLPLEDLRRFDCREEDLLRGSYSPRVGALMAFECGRARAYYLRAGGALAAEDRVSLAPAEAMRLIYQRLLARIEARHFDVFGPKITLPRYEKITLALTAWGRAQLAVRHA